MNRAFWNGRSAFAGLAIIALGLSAYVGSGVQSGAQELAVDNSPVELPGHRYDLPATHITAAQIQEHKQEYGRGE